MISWRGIKHTPASGVISMYQVTERCIMTFRPHSSVYAWWVWYALAGNLICICQCTIGKNLVTGLRISIYKV